MATLGVFMLWLGWFGFNGGSVLSADPAATSLVLVNTCLAGAAGGIGAMCAYTFVSRKPDLSMMLNGILAGLVGVTAGADTVLPGAAIFIGAVAGALVVSSVFFMDRVQVDDPVGAISVHLVCGIWGTLAVGIFSVNPDHDVAKQLLGIIAYATFTTIASFIIFALIKATIGLRVDADEELEGLDAGEHAMHAYDFLVTAGRGGGGGMSRDTQSIPRMGPSPAE
jgi:Amt family ammonium transporter